MKTQNNNNRKDRRIKSSIFSIIKGNNSTAAQNRYFVAFRKKAEGAGDERTKQGFFSGLLIDGATRGQLYKIEILFNLGKLYPINVDIFCEIKKSNRNHPNEQNIIL